MAFNPIKKYPLDTKPSIGVGIGVPFNGNAVFKTTYLTKDAIKSNLINFFLTNQNERFLNNRFGANLRAFIFEQLTNDNINFLKEDIQTKVNQYFPNVQILNLTLTPNPDENQLTIQLFYKVPNTNIEDKIDITFQ